MPTTTIVGSVLDRAPSPASLLAGALLSTLSVCAACRGGDAAQAPSAPVQSPPPEVVTPEAATAEPATPKAPASIHELSMRRLDGTEVSLADWKGKTLLVVNTASRCGHTPQYEGLQALHARFEARGFAVLGFPSNDFGGQEPGTSEEIAQFCTSMYAVNFPMFEKVETKGPGRAPLYALLSDALGAPQWNFHKYLVDAAGKPVQAWGSGVLPRSPEVIAAIERQLGE